MKKISALIGSILLLGCSNDDSVRRCNFLLDVNVEFVVNLNLPQFNQLNFVSGVARIDGQGNGGLYVIRVNNETLRAFDGADPNHAFSSCSIMELDGTIVQCNCGDANRYSLFTGQIIEGDPQPCGLREYRVFPLGNNSFTITD